jgi:hypothetical protein
MPGDFGRKLKMKWGDLRGVALKAEQNVNMPTSIIFQMC